ncbi:hypothetical protein [Psychrobacter sp.]|uniref:hypothetical protein n=1 Tax=Psychrobacter sp. TaxID=56811 RepID=UPI0025D40181|nr:hypothetical protein [Psychrobacter sp.]
MSNQLVVDIVPNRSWQRLYRYGFLFIILLVASATQLSLYWIFAIAIFAVLLIKITELKTKPQLVHLTGCNLDESDAYWQLLYNQKSQTVLWQAHLISSQSFPHCIQLIFDTVQPLQKRENILIWKDQVTLDTWRELKVLTRW